MRALVLIAAVTAAGLTLAEPPDLKTLTECSDRAWEQDIGSWANYAFDRQVTRRSLDKNDKVTSTQKMRFRVTPSAEGFDEVLVEIDGRKRLQSARIRGMPHRTRPTSRSGSCETAPRRSPGV